MSLGGKRSPFAPYNPFLRPSHSVRSQSHRIPWIVRSGLTNTTTTDTTNGAVAYSAASEIIDGEVAIMFFVQCHLKHSVGNAEVRGALEIWNTADGSDSGATIWQFRDTVIPTADTFAIFQFTAPLYFSGHSSFSLTPGRRLIQVRFTPETAGTLTIGNSASTFDRIDAFILGGLQI